MKNKHCENGGIHHEQNFYDNGKIWFEVYHLNGKNHNENGPAYRSWYENGQIRTEQYWLNDVLHNENDPAYRMWHPNGQIRYEAYYLNNNLHNENGPAYRSWDENGQLYYEKYYLNGKELSKEEFGNRGKIINSVASVSEEVYNTLDDLIHGNDVKFIELKQVLNKIENLNKDKFDFSINLSFISSIDNCEEYYPEERTFTINCKRYETDKELKKRLSRNEKAKKRAKRNKS